MKRKIGIVVGLLILLSGMAHAAGAIKAADSNKAARLVTCALESDGRCTLSADIISILGTAIATGSGVITAGTIRITIATDDTVATDLTAIKTAVQILDDWDESDRAKVNVIAGQAGITANAGNAAANSPRVVIATDDVNQSAIKTAVEIMDDWDESDRAKVNIIAGQAGVAANTGAVGVTVPRVTVANDDVVSTGIAVMDDWDATHDSAASADGPQIMLEARSSRGTAVANGDAVRQAANPYGESIFAGYTWLTNSIRVDIINPLTEAHVEPTLCDLTNIAADTAAACGYWDMDGYRHFSVQIETSGTAPTDVLTVTIDCTNQDDTTAPASCAYQDLTSVLAGKVSLIDADDFWIIDTVVAFKYCRIWYTTSDTGGSDADLTVFLKKLW